MQKFLHWPPDVAKSGISDEDVHISNSNNCALAKIREIRPLAREDDNFPRFVQGVSGRSRQNTRISQHEFKEI